MNNHNHGHHRNPLTVVHCGDLPSVLSWLRGMVDTDVSSTITHLGASPIHMYKRKSRTILIMIIPMLVVDPELHVG
jgi:hypothetical protein